MKAKSLVIIAIALPAALIFHLITFILVINSKSDSSAKNKTPQTMSTEEAIARTMGVSGNPEEMAQRLKEMQYESYQRSQQESSQYNPYREEMERSQRERSIREDERIRQQFRERGY